jgi:hypothetical protein
LGLLEVSPTGIDELVEPSAPDNDLEFLKRKIRRIA